MSDLRVMWRVSYSFDTTCGSGYGSGSRSFETKEEAERYVDEIRLRAASGRSNAVYRDITVHSPEMH